MPWRNLVVLSLLLALAGRHCDLATLCHSIVAFGADRERLRPGRQVAIVPSNYTNTAVMTAVL